MNSLRTRLFVSFALLVLLALVMAGTVFVALRRGASDRETLDRLSAAAPGISFELRTLYDRGAGQQQVDDYLRQASRDRGVRILVVDWRDGTVVSDSGSNLRGTRLVLPDFSDASPSRRYQPHSWRGTTPETQDLTLFTGIFSVAGRPVALGRNPSDPGGNLITVVAVPRQTIANAWLGLLPGLAWAGLVALALSAVMAILLSRSIARPILALARASEEIAKGNFQQEVPPSRSAEIGRLAAAFNTMAREVGRSYLQTRALLANVSHDLKTPLTSILGFAQALRDGAAEDPADVRELSGIIHEEAERIFAIVEDLLYLSQLEAGEVIVESAPVNLSDLASRRLSRIDASLRERRITVESHLEADTWIVADASKIERIFDNLLDNARKYTPDGGRIVVALHKSDSVPRRAIVRVFNTGSFIPGNELERVFDRFYRTDRSRGSATRGTGLGLAIVKDLVELQKGTIRAESRAGDGTAFEVAIPLAEAPARGIAVSDAAERASGSSATREYLPG